ncbi:MAG: hypothetical protein WBQ46_01120 [Terriglobales bacterium]
MATKPEYIEGPEALENFERFGRAILQAPKPKGKTKKEAKVARSRKAKRTDKN